MIEQRSNFLLINYLDYPKNLDFDAKQGGFNVLNTPDEFYKTPDQFWDDYNKPFLDKAIQPGDDIILTTKPTDSFLNKYDDFGNYVGRTGFGKEVDYLKSKGYVYDSAIKKMVKP